MTIKFLNAVAYIGAVLSFSAPSFASTLKTTGFNDIAQSADACVIATAGNSVSESTDDGVVTKTTFTVGRTAFGKLRSKITVVTPGGRLQNTKVGMAEVHPGTPLFLTGSKSMLFLDRKARGEYTVAGAAQGVFSVIDGPDGEIVRLPSAAGGAVSVDDALARAVSERASRANELTNN